MDNAPQFSSENFRKFASEWDIQHETSSPQYPQSNVVPRRRAVTHSDCLFSSKVQGELDHIAAVIGWKAGYTMDRYRER
ncbi:hypothetical protein AOLI_G00090190 [Acnodon oligacanthus]